MKKLQATLAASMLRPDRCLHFLRPGRIVRVQDGSVDWGWGVVVSVLRTGAAGKQQGAGHAASAYVVDTLLCCAPGSGKRAQHPV